MHPSVCVLVRFHASDTFAEELLSFGKERLLGNFLQSFGDRAPVALGGVSLLLRHGLLPLVGLNTGGT